MNSESGFENATEKIKLLSAAHGFGIAQNTWREALAKAKPDPVAKIKHAELGGDSSWRVHVAEVGEKVACHVHFEGHEIYEIVSGRGVMLSSPVEKNGSVCSGVRCDSLPVRAGDVFSVPEGFAHQLVRDGDDPLIILFACSDNHLGDDRMVLPDMKP
jgi:mannose-6-phosphate isomerase-like protein (cupin superfamily)